jgi:hypothetical protein
MISSIEAHDKMQKHYQKFEEEIGLLGYKKRVDVSFTEVLLPNPNTITKDYHEECRVDWHIECRADHEYLLSYAVLLNEKNEFDGYALLFEDQDEPEIFTYFYEVTSKINGRL